MDFRSIHSWVNLYSESGMGELVTHTRFAVQVHPTMDFRSIHSWVNLYSESGMGDKVSTSGGAEESSAEEARPWLIQDVPELTKDSQADICFKGEGLCVIYLADGVAPAADVDMLAGMKAKFTSQLDG